MSYLVANLAGTSFHTIAADMLYRLGEGAPLVLEAEPSNPYDPEAIKVGIFVGPEQGLLMVGHVGRSSRAGNGLVGTREFHAARRAWDSAVLKIADTGGFRVRIEVPE